MPASSRATWWRPLLTPTLWSAITTYYWRVDEIDAIGQQVRRRCVELHDHPPGPWHCQASDVGEHRRHGSEPICSATRTSRSLRDGADEVTAFRSRPTLADNYGGRLSAWLHVPVAGDYTFWVASDDDSQLFFGSHPGKAKMIAAVWGWTADRAFDWQATQKSATMKLDAGVYFIEALWKEGGGGDNCSAAWARPGSAAAGHWRRLSRTVQRSVAVTSESCRRRHGRLFRPRAQVALP